MPTADALLKSTVHRLSERLHKVSAFTQRVLEVLAVLAIERFNTKAGCFRSRSRFTSFEIGLAIFTIHTHFGRAALIHRMDSSVPRGNIGNV